MKDLKHLKRKIVYLRKNVADHVLIVEEDEDVNAHSPVQDHGSKIGSSVK